MNQFGAIKDKTKVVAGTMALRNRAVSTSVFWGIRPVTAKYRQRRLDQMDHQNDTDQLDASDTSSSSASSSIGDIQNIEPVEYITLSSDDEPEQETRKNAVVEEQPVVTDVPMEEQTVVETPTTSVSSVTVVAPQRNKKPATLPVRKSRRINKEEKGNEEELIANFNNGTGVINRGTIVPIGLTRKPFHLRSEQKADRLKDKLRIDMQPVFTPAGPVSQGFPAENVPAEPEPVTCTFMQTDRKVIRVGDEFQATLPDELLSIEDTRDEPDPDERLWDMPAEFNDDTFRNVYWRAIWRQFEGHIPMEVALQHFWQSGYNYAKALDSIDQKLKVLPQAFKPLTMGQQKEFLRLIADKKTTRRNLQEKAMRNYHIAEVQEYHYRNRRYFKYQERAKEVACNCLEELCSDQEYEPRWACSNCTQNMRLQSSKKLCLICQTYRQITGNRRPARDVVFNDDDLAKIEAWCRMESDGDIIERPEFERRLEAEQEKRWKNNEVTPEEHETLILKDLRIQQRKSKLSLTDREKVIRGEKMAMQLKPYILPHFTKCRCIKTGKRPRKSVNTYKYSFEQPEVDKYYDTLVKHHGDIWKASEELGVEMEVIHLFFMRYGHMCHLYNLYPGNTFPNYKLMLRDVPPTNLPPIIPDFSTSTNSSRDGSPYVPPEERPGNKRRRVQ